MLWAFTRRSAKYVTEDYVVPTYQDYTGLNTVRRESDPVIHYRDVVQLDGTHNVGRVFQGDLISPKGAQLDSVLPLKCNGTAISTFSIQHPAFPLGAGVGRRSKYELK